MKTLRLNLGSYLHPLEGYLNVDRDENFPDVDLVWDLNLLPWPFPDQAFDEVRAVDILEHLGKLTKEEAVQELARVTKIGGQAIVRVPNVSHPWAIGSIQHAHLFAYNSFEKSYAQPWFEVKSITVGFTDQGREYKFNRFWRTLCKYTRFIQVLRFTLRRVW